ncbi:hypothetical protein CRI94_12295 [Longibacter salinarum]|uniref:Cell surface protein n=1 Tax=Longibacter salinarum TaxID=1850348 RepID=A0A2A8CWM2_9BACT|nr:hypothetical protein [Longibacter salinarum]PEN12788.1 hypothetical protein CRI94_12295 [Longibacter salinarum]
MRTVSLLSLLSLFLLFTGCDLTEDDSMTVVTSGVYIANGGAFGNANSSLTIFNPQTEALQTLPPAGQAGFSSYIQSIEVGPRGRLFVVFGETATVDIYDTPTNERIGQITGIPNPRYVAVNGDRAYVTSQDYGVDPSDVDVVDLTTSTVVDSVDVPGTPEDVEVLGSTIVVALGGFGSGSSIGIIDANDLTVQTIDIGCTGPRSLVRDEDDEVIVFCTGIQTGNPSTSSPGAIRVVDPSTGSISDEVELTTQISSASFGQHVSYSSAAEEAYALLADGRVLRYDTATNQIESRLDVAGDSPGAVGYDDRNELLYIGRLSPASPFDESGTVTVHERGGAAVDTIQAGVAPAHIDFSINAR